MNDEYLTNEIGPEIKRVTLHPVDADGNPDTEVNLYPKTLLDGIVDREGKSVEVQEKLIDGENIKTINGDSILGSGNIEIVDAYTKEESDEKFLSKEVAAETYETIIDVNEKFANKEYVDSKENLIKTTWAELKTLRDNSQLIPGRFYRITDYICTTTQENTQSAGHVFDIIVLALDTDKLSEEASAIQHEGDTYFANNKLETWKLYYCLDNDTNRFTWADTINGKGVIYRMIDEWNNEAPYDFKNIQFKRYKITECQKSPSLVGKYLGIEGGKGYTVDTTDFIWCYTFTWINENNVVEDCSIVGQTLLNDEGQYSGVFNNKLAECSAYETVYPEAPKSFGIALNNIVIQATYEYEGGNFYGIHSNTFGNTCYNNTFGNSYSSNTFGNGCYRNIFGNDCYDNIFGNGCSSNTFGNGCAYNTFGNSCSSNIFGNSCYNNAFGNSCGSNTFGNSCSNNIFGNSCGRNTFGNNCDNNIFGANCGNIIFGAIANSANTPADYYQNNIVDNACKYLYLNSTETALYNNQLQNIHIHSRVRGTGSAHKTITVNRNLSYITDVYPMGSSKIEV